MAKLQRNVTGGSGRGRGAGEDGSGRGRNYFGGLKERFPGTQASTREEKPPQATRDEKHERIASKQAENKSGKGQSSQTAAAHRESQYQAVPACLSSKEPQRSNGQANELPGLRSSGEKSRLLGTIDTQEMKELMKRLNFTK